LGVIHLQDAELVVGDLIDVPNVLEVCKERSLGAGCTAIPLQQALPGVEDGEVVEHLISDSFLKLHRKGKYDDARRESTSLAICRRGAQGNVEQG